MSNKILLIQHKRNISEKFHIFVSFPTKRNVKTAAHFDKMWTGFLAHLLLNKMMSFIVFQAIQICYISLISEARLNVF